jgi:hypothetical protein
VSYSILKVWLDHGMYAFTRESCMGNGACKEEMGGEYGKVAWNKSKTHCFLVKYTLLTCLLFPTERDIVRMKVIYLSISSVLLSIV